MFQGLEASNKARNGLENRVSELELSLEAARSEKPCWNVRSIRISTLAFVMVYRTKPFVCVCAFR